MSATDSTVAVVRGEAGSGAVTPAATAAAAAPRGSEAKLPPLQTPHTAQQSSEDSLPPTTNPIRIAVEAKGKEKSLAKRKPSSRIRGALWPSCVGSKTSTAFYYFRHPLARAAVAIGISPLNLLMLAEDPVSHSQTTAEIPLVGQAFSLLVTQWPSHGGFLFLKALCALIAVIGGICFGILVIHHKLLRPRVRTFRESNGTWFIAFFTTICTCFLMALVYNLILLVFGVDESDAEPIDATLGTTNETFMKTAAVGTWLGDTVTALMVLDVMAQDVDNYSHILPKTREFYRSAWNGWFRILFFWGVLFSLTAVLITALITSVVSWDDYATHPTSELGRSLLAGAITLLDLCILVADWEFPDFNTPQEVKIAGFSIANLSFTFCRDLIKRLRFPSIDVVIEGRWFQYGIIVIVMMLDTNMLKNQVLYSPELFGQYTGPNSHIYTVVNRTSLDIIGDNTTALSFDVRGGDCATGGPTALGCLEGDEMMQAKYFDYSIAVTSVGFLLIAFGLFMLFYLARIESDVALHTARTPKRRASILVPVRPMPEAEAPNPSEGKEVEMGKVTSTAEAVAEPKHSGDV